MRCYYTLFALIFCFSGMSKAQQATVTSGGDVSGNSGSVSYSVGQVMYTSHEGSRGSVVHGVQQPFEINIFYGLEEKTISLEMTAYPNPTIGMLYLKTSDERSFTYQLYNLQGQVLLESTFNEGAKIDMGPYPQSTYQLHISHDQQVIKSFQIIKY